VKWGGHRGLGLRLLFRYVYVYVTQRRRSIRRRLIHNGVAHHWRQSLTGLYNGDYYRTHSHWKAYVFIPGSNYYYWGEQSDIGLQCAVRHIVPVIYVITDGVHIPAQTRLVVELRRRLVTDAAMAEEWHVDSLVCFEHVPRHRHALAIQEAHEVHSMVSTPHTLSHIMQGKRTRCWARVDLDDFIVTTPSPRTHIDRQSPINKRRSCLLLRLI